MKYISTRGNAPVLGFEEVVLAGLASDGGLYVPEFYPEFSMPEIAAMRGISYSDLSYRIISRFTGHSIPAEILEKIITESYSNSVFRHRAIAPLKQLDSQTYLLELFHGPTLAFKDFALQFLGRLLDYILSKKGDKALIIGATSGDTGSAAIAGCAGRSNMEIVILHPKNRVSEVQRRQMTSITDKNVHNLAVNGSFDDCQNIVKAIFASKFDDKTENKLANKQKINRNLVAVNSINWARIVAQIVYYFYASLNLGSPARKISFCVPTGNFGDIYAGYIAKKLGLPIDKLIIATNKNDILARTLKTGIYQMSEVTSSLSPSMDIQISSNFERLLFDLHERDGKLLAQMMNDFREKKSLTLSPAAYQQLSNEFLADSCSDDETLATIRKYYEENGELLDPHSAVGLYVANTQRNNLATPIVVLATASAAKFPEAVEKASKIKPQLPEHLADLLSRPERVINVDNNLDEIINIIKNIIN